MKKKRLLIIEDDHDLGEMLYTYFDSQNYDVLHAHNGAEGVSLARAKFPNLILLDVMLPDMEGFDVCRILRTSTLTKYIPITFLTQRDDRADKVVGLQLGADDYITKPFDIEELRLRVDRSIKRATREHIHETRTGLPTGQLIASEYHNVVDGGHWHCYLFKINGHLAFRDIYGFLAADDVVSLASSIISNGVARYGTSDDFIGISGNDFIVFTRSDDPNALQDYCATRFTEQARAFYNFTEVEQGHVVLNPGTDNQCEAPLMHFVVEDFELEEV